MAKFAGRKGRLAVSSTGGAPFTEVNGIVDVSLTGAEAEINVTSHDSGQFEEFIAGRKDATLDGSLHFDDDDPGQNIVKNAYFSGTRIDVRFRMKEESGADEIFAKALVTSFTMNSTNDDSAQVDFTLRITGDFSLASQP